MSDAGMSCQICGKPNNVQWGICADCLSAKTKKRQKEQLVASSAKKEKGKASTAEPTWQIEMQPGSVEKTPYPYFSKNAGTIAALIYTDAAANINSNAATAFGGQYTIETFDDTCSLDVQGCRQGGNKFWLDYQGQLGGGSKKRKSYFQVMIMCGSGVPDTALMQLAISQSNGSKMRSVLYLNTTDRPR